MEIMHYAVKKFACEEDFHKQEEKLSEFCQIEVT
jgi:hypothetical protein